MKALSNPKGVLFCSLRLIISFIFLLIPSAYALAGLQSLPAMYGILPADIAMAGAQVGGFSNAEAAYYNPAALADAEYTDLSLGYLYAQPFLKGGVVGEEKSFDKANKAVSICAISRIGRIFTKNYPIGVALAVMLDDNGKKLANFEDRYDENGRFVRYGMRDISLSHGWGFRLFNGLNLGAGLILGYKTSVISDQDVQITGDIQNEQITFLSEPAVALTFGVQWTIKKARLGLVYRGEKQNTIAPVGGTNTIKADEFVLKSFEISLEFRDGFDPQQVALGFIYDISPKFLVSAQLEWLDWDGLNEYIPDWDVNGQDFDIETEDIYQPRLGVSFKGWQNLEIRGGYAYEPSPFKRLGRFSNLILDNDRHRLTAGAGYSIKPSFLVAPVSFDVAIVSFYLIPRENETSDHKILHSEGYLLGASASFTIRF